MFHLPPNAVRPLTWVLASLLAVSAGVGGAVVQSAPAQATPSPGGPTGLHDRMMPADSPDAQAAGPTVAAGTQAGTAVAPASGLLGVDVARYQHPNGAAIDWGQVQTSGRQFAVVKATEMYTDTTTGQPVLYTNPYLQSDLSGAHAAGLVVGAYAFAHPENSAVAQADALSNAMGALPAGSLPPVLDLENNGGLSVSALVTWTQTFLTELAADTHTTPMIYSGPSFWSQSMGGSAAFTGYPLWEAHYTTAPAPAAMGGWPTYTMWQFTDGTYAVPPSGPYVPGITGKVDQDLFNTSNGATPSNLHAPVGSFDSAKATGTGALTVSGWALDPDTPTAAGMVAVYVDGVGRNVTADGSRPDVGATYPAAGSQHGFTATAQLTLGSHTVCAYAIDTTDSTQHTTLDCKTVTVVPDLPLGSLDTALVDRTGVLSVTGWAFDPDAPTTASTVHVYVDSQGQALTANGSRADVGAAFPNAGSLHGYSATAQLSPGGHTVCAYGIDSTYASVHSTLGCRAVTFNPQLPLGSFDSAQVDGTGKLTVSGWAYDPDAPTAPDTVNVVVDGLYSQTLTANGSRPDVGAAYPTAGSQHGFTATAQLTAGTHVVCAYAVDNVYSTLHTTLDCTSVTVVPTLPIGSLDSAQVSAGTLTVSGWAFDPDTPTVPSTVHVYVDSTGQAVTADGSRPDVGASFPAAGSQHGFTATAQLTPGSHTVCAFGVDTTYSDRHSTLGCRTVTSG